MYLIYSVLLSVGFLLMSPLFLLRREKYVSGFKQRLGKHPKFDHDGRKVIWLHCVSVGETNAARPLVDQLLIAFPDHRLVISTTTKTGQELAQKIFAGKADAVFYFPFDWEFSVRKALENYKPTLVLLMETEIWPRFIREAKQSGAMVAIVNGRLSERSVRRYSKVRSFMKNALENVDLGLMQNEADANRISLVGFDPARVFVTGNLKFDVGVTDADIATTEYIRDRFGINGDRPLLVAASTHEPEEQWIINAFASTANDTPEPPPRLLLAPRHPERFDHVAKILDTFRNSRECEWRGYSLVRRSGSPLETDRLCDVILLDSIGELRSIYALSDIVFVGGSLIPHGGQSVLEPAAEGRAIVTGHFTRNFDSVVKEFLINDALIQLPSSPQDFQNCERLYEAFRALLENKDLRMKLGSNAAAAIRAGGGATDRTIAYLKQLLDPKTGS